MGYDEEIFHVVKGDGHELKARFHGYNHEEQTWSWWVELTRPGDNRPPNVVGRNRPGWPEFYHKDGAWEAADQLHSWARQHGMLDKLPVEQGLRMVDRLHVHLLSLEPVVRRPLTARASR